MCQCRLHDSRTVWSNLHFCPFHVYSTDLVRDSHVGRILRPEEWLHCLALTYKNSCRPSLSLQAECHKDCADACNTILLLLVLMALLALMAL